MSNLATQEQPKTVTVRVLSQINNLVDKGSIALPPDYAVGNALNSAWLWIQNSEQRDKLLACTDESKINALHDMVLQCGWLGKTGYMIPYGSRMVYQRDYHGEVALAQRVKPGIEPYGDVVYRGEKFLVVKERNRYGLITAIKTHEMAFPRESKEIIAAYWGFIDENGEDMGAEIMDMDQIRTSWKKSKQYSANSQTFHNEQPDIACKRTVSRRRCKPIIKTSTDAWLLQALARQDIEETAAEMDEIVSEKANKGMITMPAIEQGSVQTSDDVPNNLTDEVDKVIAAQREALTPEAPAPVAATPEPEATPKAQETPVPAQTPPQRLSLTPEQVAECKDILAPSGQSYVLVKAQAEKEGIVTFEDFKSRIEALAPKAEEGPGY